MDLIIKQVVHFFPFLGVALMLAAGASAASITHNTADSTGFAGISLTYNNSAGHDAAPAFLTVAETGITVPSQTAFRFFTLECELCMDTSVSTFDALTFSQIVIKIGSGATGMFISSSDDESRKNIVALNSGTEPATLSLIGGGLLVSGLIRRRRTAQS